MINPKTNKGFIALITSIIISVILVGLVFTTSTSGFFSRIGAINSEYKRLSLYMAESCADLALLNIAKDYSYTPIAGGETLTIGDGHCLIQSVTYGAEDPITHRKIALINTVAEHRGSWTNIKVEASIGNPTLSPTLNLSTIPNIFIISWQEI